MKLTREFLNTSPDQLIFRVFKREEQGFDPYWHYHPELELTFIEEGTGLRYVGDDVQRFESGDLVLLGKNLPHQWVSDQECKHSIAHVVQFSAEILEHLSFSNDLSRFFDSAGRGLKFLPDKQVTHRFRKLSDQPPVEQFGNFVLMLQDLMEAEGSTALSTVVFDTQYDRDSRESKVHRYLLEHLDEDLSLDFMADLADLAPSSFSRWFSGTFEESFVDYLRAMRIARACQYLLQTSWSISQVAYHSGFDSLSNFNRSFKRLKGVNPSAYRQRGR